jgi:23S rRNA (adenine2503-C2)-methyltransferase
MTQAVTAQGKIALSDLGPQEIAERLALKPFQGRQIFHWIHQKKVFDFESMTDLSKTLRVQLIDLCTANRLSLVNVSISEASGTRKALLEMQDGETVESVLIPDRDRNTLCLSTQVGCAVKCSFCATGLSGYARNLSAGEIVEQALYLLRDVDLGGKTPNIVYMGMGEPFRNYDAVAASIRLLMHPEGMNIGARKITVSTAGEVPGIRRFAQEDWQVRLSVSLHAATDTLRDELVPLNRKYNLARLLEAVRDYQAQAGRQVTFEWALLAGVNDSEAQARELAELIGDLNAFVNLIPYNPVAELGYAPPSMKQCKRFRDVLMKRGINATLRAERGQDIDAACGQLRRRTELN